MPFVPPGVETDGKTVFTSDEALKLEWVPDYIAIIGSGACDILPAAFRTACHSGGRTGWPAILSGLKSLLETGKAYRCTCSKERLDALREEQKANKTRLGYDGCCRDAGHGPDCGPHVVRLKMPTTGTTVVDDLIK